MTVTECMPSATKMIRFKLAAFAVGAAGSNVRAVAKFQQARVGTAVPPIVTWAVDPPTPDTMTSY